MTCAKSWSSFTQLKIPERQFGLVYGRVPTRPFITKFSPRRLPIPCSLYLLKEALSYRYARACSNASGYIFCFCPSSLLSRYGHLLFVPPSCRPFSRSSGGLCCARVPAYFCVLRRLL